MISPRLAAELLAEHGIDVDLELRGISSSMAKRRALAQAGASLNPNIVAAQWGLDG